MMDAQIERFNVGIGTDFDAVRRGYTENVETRHDGAEKIITTLGEYAIQQPPGELWQLTPADDWRASFSSKSSRPIYRPTWVTLEEMRTRASEGDFALDHMDALENSIGTSQRACNNHNKLNVATVKDLGKLLTGYDIDSSEWQPAELQNLFGYVGDSEKYEVEDVSLHDVGGELWLASTQAMVNVYYKDLEEQTWRLSELQKRYYNIDGTLGQPVASRQRSSLGETGHRLGDVPERPFDIAWRGLSEEINASRSAICQLVATGGLLRLKGQGHHRFGPYLKAQDSTYYFDAWLHPDAVQAEGYTNTELDSAQRPRVDIELKWSLVE